MLDRAGRRGRGAQDASGGVHGVGGWVRGGRGGTGGWCFGIGGVLLERLREHSAFSLEETRLVSVLFLCGVR